MSELLKKYESIDQSKLSEATIKILNRVKTITADFTADDAKNNDIAEKVMNEILKKNPDAARIVKREPKAKPAPKKTHKAKGTHKAKATHKATSAPATKTSSNNIMSVAKEIQKAGESWKDAMERAKQVLKERKEENVQKGRTEMEKLLALVRTKKELQGFANSDLPRDSRRTALPRGRRISKDGNLYYENRENRTDRLAPNYPQDMPLLARGGVFASDNSAYLTDSNFGDFQDGVMFGNGGSLISETVSAIFNPNQKRGKIETGFGSKTKEGLFAMMTNVNYSPEEITTAVFVPNAKKGRIYTEWGAKTKEGLHEMIDNMRNTFEHGGSMASLTEQEFLKKYFGANVFAENPSQYFEIKKMSSDNDAKVNAFVKELKADGFTVKKRAYSDFTSVMGVKKKASFANGGAFVMTDLAGHTGGSDGLGNPMPLSGVSGTHYTGLVGETGAMSSGELFENGGGVENWKKATTIKRKTRTEAEKGKKLLEEYWGKSGRNFKVEKVDDEYVVRYEFYLTDKMELGGAMMQNQQVINDASQPYVITEAFGNPAQQLGVFKDGGSIPNNYKGKYYGDVWNNEWTDEQKRHFLSDHKNEIGFEEEFYSESSLKRATKRIKSSHGTDIGFQLIDSEKLINTKSYNLPKYVQFSLEKHIREGQYAYGGRTKSTPSMRKLYIEQIAFATNTRSVGVDAFAKEHNLTDSELSNLMTGLGRKMISQSDFITALVGDKDNPKQKEVVAFAKSDKAYKMADGGDVGYFDNMSEEEILKSTIVFDNNGESYDRYTVFTPDDSVFGMSEDARGFNMYIGDKSEIPTGKHLGKKLTTVPQGIRIAVLNRMKEEYANGGSFAPNVADGTQFMNGVYADGGSINGMLNKKIQKLSENKGLTMDALGRDEFNKVMTQALVESLTDANFHDEAKQVVVKAEGKTKWSNELYQSESFSPDAKVASFAREVARICEYDGDDILNAYYFITKTQGSKVGNMIDDLFLNNKTKKDKFTPTIEFSIGDTVWQKDEKRYATVMNNYGDSLEGSNGDVRLDTTGNTPIFTWDKDYVVNGYNLVKLGEKGDAGKFTPDVLAEMKESANRLIDSRKQSKDKEGVAYYQNVYKRLLDGEFDSMTEGASKPTKYIDHDDIKSVTVKYKGKEVSFKGEDVLNGANLMENGGDLSKIAFYIPKRDVISVELKNGDIIHPVNGYWIKKGAEPIKPSVPASKVPTALGGTAFMDNAYFANGGKVGSYEVMIDGDWDEPKKFKTFSLAKKWIYENIKNHDSLELVDSYGDSIYIDGNDTKEDLDWLFGNHKKGIYADGGSTGSGFDPVKVKVVIAVGLDRAIEFYDSEYPIRPYQLLERAVRGGYITLDEITEDVVDSAMETARDSEDMDEVGSSDFGAYLRDFLDEAGFKIGYVNGRLTREYADGGGISKKLESGVYRVGKPTKVSPNLYEQKIVEIFDNGDIATASDYGRKLVDFKSQKYPIISKEQLNAQYKMADGGEIRRFNRHEQMDSETREEVLDVLSEPQLNGSLTNYLYGLYDGYDYSETENFKKEMSKLKSKDLAMYDRINAIYKKIDKYKFEKYDEYASGGELKSRLSNDFLIVDIDGEKYKSWFPNWISLDKNYLKKLEEEDKSVLIIEKNNGISKRFEVEDRNIMDTWLNDKSAKKPRQILIEKTKEYHASSKKYADGGMFDDNDGFMRADNERSFRYPEREVRVDSISDSVDLTNDISYKPNEVVIRTLDENIDLSDDNRIRARMGSNPMNRNPNKMMAVNPRMIFTDLPKATSSTHKND